MNKLNEMLIEEGITPNEFYIIECLNDNINSKLVNNHLELRKLKTGGYIEGANLTDKAFELIDKSKSISSVIAKKKRKKEEPEEYLGKDYKTDVNKYNQIFPNRKLNTGKQARSHIKNISPGFVWFFKEYDYTWEEIYKATAVYVEERRRANYDFMQNSQYFVRKQNPDKTWNSSLADFCMSIRDNGGDAPSEFIFVEKTF